MRHLKIFSYWLIALVLTTCTKEEQHDRPYPRVLTHSVTDISPEGAIFHAEITVTPADIIDHGFIWSSNPNPSSNNSDVVSLGKRSGSGSFEAAVKRGLAAHQVFYVRAFATTDKYQVFGDITSFTSLGAQAPVITSFTPQSGEANDTIRIKGKNFSLRKELIQVAFKDASASVLQSTDSTLIVVVPIELSTISSNISVSVSGNKTISTTPFTLIPAEFVAINKSTFSTCDTLIITTAHVKGPVSAISIVFDQRPVTPISFFGGKFLKVIAPFLPATTTSVNLKLALGGQSSAFPAAVTYQPSSLVSVAPASVGFQDTITLSVSNPPRCNLRVTMNGIQANIVQTSSAFIKAAMPTGITAANVNVQMFTGTDLVGQSTIPRAIKITSIDPSGTFNDIIKIQGSGFHPTASKNVVCFDCGTSSSPHPTVVISASPHELRVRFPANYSGPPNGLVNVIVTAEGLLDEKRSAFQVKPPIITSIAPANITNGSIVTVTGQNFNPTTGLNSLTLQSNSNALKILSASPTTLTFQANSLAIAGNDPNLGSTYSSNVSLQVSGQTIQGSTPLSINYVGPWKAAQDFPGTARTGALRFSFDHKIYFGLGRSAANTSLAFKDFWRYDPASNQWTQLSDFPGSPRDFPNAWILNNNGYVAFGRTAGYTYLKDVWRFDPTSESWTQLPDFSKTPNTSGQVGVLHGKAYMGIVDKEVWSFDASETWTRKNDAPYYLGGEMIPTSTELYIKFFTTNGSDGLRMYKYSEVSDTWSLTTIPVYAISWFFPAFNSIMYNVVGNSSIAILDQSNNTWQDVYSPTFFSTFAHTFYLENKMYMVVGKKVWSLDYSLYPIH